MGPATFCLQLQDIVQIDSNIGHADGLSRLPLPLDGQSVDRLHEPAESVCLLQSIEDDLSLDAGRIARLNSRDALLSRVLTAVQFGEWPDDQSLQPYRIRRDELYVIRGVLLWGNRVVVPHKAQDYVLRELHVGHPGVSSMKSAARSCVWWPRVDDAIESYVRSCSACQLQRALPAKIDLHQWSWPRKPWSRVHLDYAGPVEGGRYLLVVVDAMTKWVEVKITSSQTSSMTVDVFRSLCTTFGLPDTVVTDNGPAFVGEEFQTFVKRNGIRHITAAPHHPASNGLAERYVREVKCAIKKSNDQSLQLRIANWLMKQHTTASCTTGVTPAHLMFGR